MRLKNFFAALHIASTLLVLTSVAGSEKCSKWLMTACTNRGCTATVLIGLATVGADDAAGCNALLYDAVQCRLVARSDRL